MSALEAVLEEIRKGFAEIAKAEPVKKDETPDLAALMERLDEQAAAIEELQELLAGDGEESVSKSLADIREAFDAHQKVMEMLLGEGGDGSSDSRQNADGGDSKSEGDGEQVSKSAPSFDAQLRALARGGSGRSLTLS